MKKIIVCLTAIGLLSGCNLEQAIRDPNVWKAGGDVLATASKSEASPAEEAQIGQEAASVLLGARPLFDNQEMMLYINSMGGWIAKQTGRSDINWRFGVLDTPSVNAYAAPDGYIFVTRGLLARLNNESELAGVLGHEIAHVVKRHYVIAMKQKDTAGAFANLGAAVVKSSNKGYGAEEVATPMFNLAKKTYSSGLDKADEYEADRLGVVYATRAGYDPYGLPRVLNMYAASTDSQNFEVLFSTHPSAQDRLSKLADAMGEKFASYEAKGLTDSTTFKRISAQAR